MTKNKNKIIILGTAGVGKSGVGRLLAEALGYNFFDTDIYIEKVTKRKIGDFIRKKEFIRLKSEENLMLNKIEKMDNVVVAYGGNMLFADIIEKLAKDNFTILLTGDLETVYNRIRRKKANIYLDPKIAGEKVEEKLEYNKENIMKQLSLANEEYKHFADLEVENYSCSIEEVVDLIIKKIK